MQKPNSSMMQKFCSSLCGDGEQMNIFTCRERVDFPSWQKAEGDFFLPLHGKEIEFSFVLPVILEEPAL